MIFSEKPASTFRDHDLGRVVHFPGGAPRSPMGKAPGVLGQSRAERAALRENFLSLAATRQRHLGLQPNIDRYDPDLWTDEFAFLSQPGQAEIQTDLFYDYPHQRRELSGVAGLAPAASARDPRPLGTLRPVVPGRGSRGLSAGSAEGGDPHPRRRPFRPRREARRDRGAGRRFSPRAKSARGCRANRQPRKSVCAASIFPAFLTPSSQRSARERRRPARRWYRGAPK